MVDVRVRQARADDRESVLAFCRDTWEDGDYIAEVWDRWLDDPACALLVGIVDARPVALVNMRMLSTDESWIEGLRVDPAMRQQGIGRTIVLGALAVARQRGAIVSRLFTSAQNTASQALFVAAGFEQVAAFVGQQAQAVAVALAETLPLGGALRTPPTSELERLWAFLEASNVAPLNGGLLVSGWRAQALTAALLESRLAAGEVWTLEAWETVQALAIAQPRVRSERGPRLSVQYLDGTAEGIGRLSLALRGEAARQGLAAVTAIVPDTLMLHDAMLGAGYAPNDHGAVWCYARSLQ